MRNTIFLLMTAAVMFTACEKELDLSPKDKLSSAEYWKTAEHFETGANAFYRNLPDIGAIAVDHNSDIIKHADGNTISQGLNTIPASNGTWNAAYGRIRQRNILIERGNDPDVQEIAKRYVAEARWFRVYEYFELYKKFGDVPLILRPLDTGSEELYAPRAPRTEVVDFMLNELNAIIEILPKQSDLPEKEWGRVTWNAALALKSRVALFEATWGRYHQTGANVSRYLDEALSASNALINSGEHELFYSSDRKRSYYNFFMEEGNDSKEQIVARRYNRELEVTHSYGGDAINGYGLMFNSSFIEALLCRDGLPIDKSPLYQQTGDWLDEWQNRDPRMRQMVVVPDSAYVIFRNIDGQPYLPWITQEQGGYMISKWNVGTKEALNLGKNVNFAHEIRYAEILLNHVEALWEKHGSVTDEQLNLTINAIRDRAGFHSSAFLTNGFATAHNLNIRNEIRRERMVELAVEGFRYDDIRRWKIAEQVLDKPLMGVPFKSTNFQQIYQDRLGGEWDLVCDPTTGRIITQPDAENRWEEKNYLLPIGFNEIELNPALEQTVNW
ncbi:RagB/SusD family nutrient uptake outer membrane protein [Prolixibacteraceae bacterium JC049]|nr:RagB/SusD family nutrient uptake outer membrane protein [Prolixibacteraceae bacterium JC049]